MPMTDPIADMLTRVRNASSLGEQVVTMPASKLKVAIANALQREGFIDGFETTKVADDRPHMRLNIFLRYGPNGERLISSIDRVSKPGRRVYAAVDRIPRVLNGLGCVILSTNRGILSDRECRAQRVGGEILCRVG